MNNKKSIVVAYDFSERGKNAMKHALLVGKPMEAKIIMLHITPSEKNVEKLQQKLTTHAAMFDYDFEIETKVINAHLVSGIKKFTSEAKAILVIMGSKNPSQGFEKLFGGQTLKIIMGGSVPFLSVRQAPHYEKIEKIVVPISFESHNKEKLRWVRILSHFFKFTVELFIQNEQRVEERTDTKANFLFAKRYLDRYEIKRKTRLAPKGVPFREALIAHTHKTHSDLMMIMTSEHLSILDYIIGADEEYVIANDYKIPVMCINPRIDLMQFSNFF